MLATAKSSKSGSAPFWQHRSSFSSMPVCSRRDGAMQLRTIVPTARREPARRDNLPRFERRTSPAAAEMALEFGRFRVLPRQRQLVADGVPVELGTRAFDLLMVLIEADGVLVTKNELLALVWPGIFVDPTNLKVQISLLRKALGRDRDFIRTEF